MMRKIAFLIIAVCSTVWGTVSSTAQTVHLLVPFTDFGFRSNVVRSVVCTPVSKLTVTDSLIRFPEPQTISSAGYPEITNGSVTFSNKLAGFAYRFDFSTLLNTYALTSNIGTNLNGLVNVADSAIASTNLNSAGLYAYTIAQSDARFPTFATTTNIALSVAQSVLATNGGGGGSSGNIVATSFTSYKTNSWANVSSLTVTGCVQFPFINGTNAYKPWAGSQSIYVNTNNPTTNVFLFYEARSIHGIVASWCFSLVPAFTNATTATGLLERDDNGNTRLPANELNASTYWTWDDVSQDTTAIFANVNTLETNAFVGTDGAWSFQYGNFLGVTDYDYLSFSNKALGFPVMRMGVGGENSGQTGNLQLFGIPFGQYVTNNQIGESGFEAGKINYYATYNQRSDHRIGLDLALYFNTDASGGSQIETMVQMPTYYGTANNSAGLWSRNFIRHWKGIWAGDLRVSEHTFNVIPPARMTIVTSTNDTPFLLFTNQQPSGNKQFSGTLPPASMWSDNTNIYVGGNLFVGGSAVLSNADTNRLIAQAGSAIAASNYLTTISVTTTNQFGLKTNAVLIGTATLNGANLLTNGAAASLTITGGNALTNNQSGPVTIYGNDAKTNSWTFSSSGETRTNNGAGIGRTISLMTGTETWTGTNGSVNYVVYSTANNTVTFNGSHVGNGAGLTNLDASNIATNTKANLAAVYFGGQSVNQTFLTNGNFAAGRLAVRLGDNSAYGVIDVNQLEIFTGSTRTMVLFDGGGGGRLQFTTSSGQILWNNGNTLAQNGGNFVGPLTMTTATATNGVISYRTNAATTNELSLNGFVDWYSNSAAMYTSVNKGGVITNVFRFSTP